MKFSVFTPTHNPRYLREAHWSLLNQQNTEWEWIIQPSRIGYDDIPPEIRRDGRVRMLPAMDTDNIGALKRACCDGATGNVFVELDHDDLLAPGILGRIGEAVTAGAGFIYSDFAEFCRNRQGDIVGVTPYNIHGGWETYGCTVYGRQLEAYREFEPTARSLYEIYYAPNHVRAWTRQAYAKAGRHQVVDWPVVDDFILVCQSYVTGVKFAHLNTVGYLYRRHDKNTSQRRCQDIVRQQQQVGRLFLPGLIAHWCRRQHLTYVEWSEAFDRLDWDANGKPKLPENYESGSVGCIHVDNLRLEGLSQNQWRSLSRACYRLLAPGGWWCTTRHNDVPKFVCSAPSFQTAAVLSNPHETCIYLSALKGQRQAGLVTQDFQAARVAS